MNDQELLTFIMKYQFYAVDLNLFLDTHPDCKEALEDYKVISAKLGSAMREYEKQCGPLVNFGQASNFDAEKWVEQPWPWEKKAK